MPVVSISEARDEITEHFTTGWQETDWDNVLGQLDAPVPAIRYEDRKWTDPTGEDRWVWFSVRHAPDNLQVTVGQQNGRRYRRTGVATVQIFCPVGQGLKYNDLLASVAQSIFEGKSAGNDTVSFQSSAVVEVGESGPWYQTNVTTVFTYDTVR